MDEDRNIDEATTTLAVQADASFDVSLVDDFGLQSDGTAIVGDQLTVTYGATFGIPQNVTWYKDGKVVATNSVGDGVNGGLSRTISASRWGIGTYKVSITNTEGDTAVTNEIVVTAKEDPAELLSFTLEDDYRDGTGIDYDTQDNLVIATVTMNKNYDGTFSIYKATDTKFKNALANDTLTTSTTAATATAAAATAATTADEASVLCTTAPTNYQVLNATNLGSGYGYIDNDGTVTYKWVLNNTGVERGTDYVVAFNQDSISTDTPGQGEENVSDEATAPYVETPATLAITKVAKGVAPELEFQDEDGQRITWFGTTGDTLGDLGTKSAAIYSATSNTTNEKDTGVTTLENSDAAKADAVVKGTWTATAKGNADAYFFAKVTFSKGIYGADEVSLASEAKATAQTAATDMTVLQDKDTPTTAVVNFSNLRASGTLYIVRAEGNDTGDVDDTTATISADQETAMSNAFELFDAKDKKTYRKAVAVEAGTLQVKVEGAIDKVNLKADTADYAYSLTNAYGAIFIPDDIDNFGQVATDDIAAGTVAADKWGSNSTAQKAAKSANTIGSPVVITQALKTYEIAATQPDGVNGFTSGDAVYNKNGKVASIGGTDKTDATANIVTLKDQFGEVMDASRATEAAATIADWTLTEKVSSTTTGVTGVQIVIEHVAASGDSASNATAAAAAGEATKYFNQMTVTLTAAQTGSETSEWTGKTDQGQTVTAKVNTDGTISVTIK